MSQIDHNGYVRCMYARMGASGTLADCTGALKTDRQALEKKRKFTNMKLHTQLMGDQEGVNSTKSVQHSSGIAYCQLDSPIAFEASLDLSLARLQAPL